MNLKITAFQGIEADSNGDFSYSYNTKAIPSGDFEIKVGGITKEITIQPKETSGSTSGSDFRLNFRLNFRLRLDFQARLQARLQSILPQSLLR